MRFQGQSSQSSVPSSANSLSRGTPTANVQRSVSHAVSNMRPQTVYSTYPRAPIKSLSSSTCFPISLSPNPLSHSQRTSVASVSSVSSVAPVYSRSSAAGVSLSKTSPSSLNKGASLVRSTSTTQPMVPKLHQRAYPNTQNNTNSRAMATVIGTRPKEESEVAPRSGRVMPNEVSYPSQRSSISHVLDSQNAASSGSRVINGDIKKKQEYAQRLVSPARVERAVTCGARVTPTQSPPMMYRRDMQVPVPEAVVTLTDLDKTVLHPNPVEHESSTRIRYRLLQNNHSSPRTKAVATTPVQAPSRPTMEVVLPIRIFAENRHLVVPWSAVKLISTLSSLGGTADVYSGEMISDSAPVAVKKIRELGVTKQRKESFVSEIEILQQLSHRHIVQLKGVIADDPVAVILERIDFPPNFEYETFFHFLWDVRHRGLSISAGARWAWTKQLLQAVSYLHQNNVLHLDIKTSNLMIDSSWVLKLIDFGRSRVTSDALEIVTSEDPGGTPRYLPPEVLASPSVLSDKVDVWSTACTVIEILGGPLPFEELSSHREVQIALMSGKVPSVPSFSPEFDLILKQCFDRDRKNRPTARTFCHKVFHMADPTE